MNYDRYLKMFQDQLRYPTPASHHFGIEVADGKFIGNCMYYDYDSINRQAELGIVSATGTTGAGPTASTPW